MKTYSECKIEIARQYGYLEFIGDGFKREPFLQILYDDEFYENVAKLYAMQVAVSIKQRCYEESIVFDHKKILEVEIILP